MKSKGHMRTRWLGCSMLLVPAAAWGQFAYTTRAVNMRAGPDREYPQVAWLPSGVSVTVVGCVDGYRWCDVVAGPNRGWVYAQFLSYPYQNQPVPIISGGAILGLPLITFSIGPYWDNYYRGRPWYGNRSYWYNRPAPPPYYRPPPPYYQPSPRPPVYIPPSSRPPVYVPPSQRPPGYSATARLRAAARRSAAWKRCTAEHRATARESAFRWQTSRRPAAAVESRAAAIGTRPLQP